MTAFNCNIKIVQTKCNVYDLCHDSSLSQNYTVRFGHLHAGPGPATNHGRMLKEVRGLGNLTPGRGWFITGAAHGATNFLETLGLDMHGLLHHGGSSQQLRVFQKVQTCKVCDTKGETLCTDSFPKMYIGPDRHRL